LKKLLPTPGVDCLWIGHFDLSASLGVPGQFEHPTYLEAVTYICETAKKHNRSLGQLINSISEGKTVLANEYDFVCYGTDTSIYQRALLEGISELRRAVKN
jgi:2-dehydro-3-deoxyglucarate aldolase/4-hydroxy-2-oxoheptanedioate aldolase